MVSDGKSKLPALREVKRIMEATNTQDPEPNALAELRALLKDHPDVWREGGDMGRLAINKIIADVSSVVVVKQCLWTGVDRIREELGYDRCPEVEKMVIEQVVLCWLRLNILEYKGEYQKYSDVIPFRSR